MATVTRGKIQRGDFANFDGKTVTASRPDATGGTITGLAVGNEVDVLQVFGDGNTANQSLGTITNAIQTIGSTSVTLAFLPGTWTIDDDLTIPANFHCHIPAGCIFDVATGKTLTFNGPIYAEAATFSSGAGTVDVAVDSIVNGKLWIARTAAEISAGATIVQAHYPQGNVLRYGKNTTPGTTDMSSVIQAAIDVVAIAGGEVRFPSQVYACIGLILPSGVYLRGELGPVARPVDPRGAILLANGAGTLVATDGLAQRANLGVIGMALTGLGIGTAVIGIDVDNAKRFVVRDCSFDEMSEQAVIFQSNTVACILEDGHAQNCLLDRAGRSAKIGVIDIDGADHWIVRGEYTGSSTALESVNLYICAVKVQGGNHFFDSVIGEIADVGIHIGTGTISRWVNCRADNNYGHGFEVTATAQMSNCYARDNGLETNNTYDGFNVSAGNGIFSGCMSISAAANKQRYGFNDTVASASTKNIWSACFDTGSVSGTYNFASAGAAHILPDCSPISFASGDVTPSVKNRKSWQTVNGAPTSITDFDDGVSGQIIRVAVFDSNTTFVNGSGINTSTVANKLAVINSVYTFENISGNWYEVGLRLALQTYTPTNVTPDRAFDADTVAVAELADIVGTLIADLQARDVLG